MEVITRELQRAADISDSITAGKRSWADLFVKHTFFTSGYKYYISVITASTTKEAQKVWSGYVESKVRVLVQGLERHTSIALAHAFNKGYSRTHRCTNEDQVKQVRNGILSFKIDVNDVARSVKADSGAPTNMGLESCEGPMKPEYNPESEPAPDKRLVEPEPDGRAVKLEPSNREVKPELDDGEVKQESGQGDATTIPAASDAEVEVYTTTHYIGLELHEGESSLVRGKCWCV